MKAKERHEIKTDRFLETAAIVQDFLTTHGRTILFATGAILIIVVGWLGISWYMDSREAAANADLRAAIDLESGGLTPAELETKFKEVADNHGGTSGGAIALFHLGVKQLEQGDVEAAKESFQKVVDGRYPLHWELASYRLGAIYEGEGDPSKACDVYRAVADSGTTSMPVALFAWKAGVCYQELGNTQEALRYLNMAKDSETLSLGSTLTADIERRIGELGGTGEETAEQ